MLLESYKECFKKYKFEFANESINLEMVNGRIKELDKQEGKTDAEKENINNQLNFMWQQKVNIEGKMSALQEGIKKVVGRIKEELTYNGSDSILTVYLPTGEEIDELYKELTKSGEGLKQPMPEVPRQMPKEEAKKMVDEVKKSAGAEKKPVDKKVDNKPKKDDK